jgi:transposase-like protein
MTQPIKQEKWQRLFSEQEESGESVAGFCRARGVREALFYYWKKRLREAAVSLSSLNNSAFVFPAFHTICP